MDDLQLDDEVEFAGPPCDVRRWPEHGERGVVVRGATEDGVEIAWERSTMMVRWPRESGSGELVRQIKVISGRTRPHRPESLRRGQRRTWNGCRNIPRPLARRSVHAFPEVAMCHPTWGSNSRIGMTSLRLTPAHKFEPRKAASSPAGVLPGLGMGSHLRGAHPRRCPSPVRGASNVRMTVRTTPHTIS